MRNKTKFLYPLLVILIFAHWPIDYAQSCNDDANGQDTARIVLHGPSITSSPTSVQGSSYRHSYPIPETRDYVENNSGEEFPFRAYVTPEDRAIQTLAEQINGVEEAYKVAVQWTYISEQELNHTVEKWLTPHEFLTDTPHYSSNPLQGEEVSDCEEQANTLVSLIRAEGISPEEVRVALGEVIFNDIKTGHAWVELLIEGNWVALDPSLGPYWDDKTGKLIRRQGIPFDHYATHAYPLLRAWAYYSDVYFLAPIEGQRDAPASWGASTQVK